MSDLCLKNNLIKAISTTGLVKVGNWINTDKRRYYHLFLGKDLFGDLIIKREWGSLDTKHSGGKTEILSSYNISSLDSQIHLLCKVRKQRGYYLHQS